MNYLELYLDLLPFAVSTTQVGQASNLQKSLVKANVYDVVFELV